MSEKMRVGLQDLRPRFRYTDATGTFFGLTITKKEEVVCMYALTVKILSIKKAITSVESKLIGETC